MGAGGGDQVQLLFVLEEELGFSLGKVAQLIHVMEIPRLGGTVPRMSPISVSTSLGFSS